MLIDASFSPSMTNSSTKNCANSGIITSSAGLINSSHGGIFWGYIFKRILQTIPLLFLVSIISFFLIRIAPVDPLAELRLNPSITQETLDYETQRLGLDKPVIVQYGLWLKSFVSGDLGYCTTGEKVADKLMERIPNTLLLTSFVIFFTWAVGIPLGIVAALHWRKPIDRILTLLAILLWQQQANNMVASQLQKLINY